MHPSTRAWHYSVDLARPKRTPTLAQERALDQTMAARQTCPRCRRRYYFCLPLRTLGCCLLRTTGHVVQETGHHARMLSLTPVVSP
ncbi:RRQRL motif-containing zinc-binding protein [Streptomyces coeruleorubidus]|uniref:RRQRL motif-containing zinc-binding protein n=1 Tax=Streptomyces coeruleorubidus TaxID=116188 RepID=UPI0033B1A07F